MYKIVYYKTEKGELPFKKFIDKVAIKTKAKVRKYVALLSIEGPNLRRPYADYLRDGIYELRIKFSPNENRLLYFFFQGTDIVITHGFVKKTVQVPEGEIKKALKYKLDFEMRNKNEKKRLL